MIKVPPSYPPRQLTMITPRPSADWLNQTHAALVRASQRAWELAARTQTPLHFLHDGQMIRVVPESPTHPYLSAEAVRPDAVARP